MLKKLYIALVRGLGRLLNALGLLGWLERRRGNLACLYLRSLFAVYDLDTMVRLDVCWWNFKTMAEVDRFLSGRNKPEVFEYGSGASTLWLARRAFSVVSLEYDDGWFASMKRHTQHAGNVELRLVPPDAQPAKDPLYRSEKKGFEDRSFFDFASAIRTFAAFDLIVIDGRARAACLKEAVAHLKPGGVILFDDTHRARYRKAALSCPDFEVTSLRGLTPTLPYPNESSLLRRR